MRFLRDENAQDVVEYALLLAFVVVASAALFLVNSASMAGIWNAGNNLLERASSTAKSQ